MLLVTCLVQNVLEMNSGAAITGSEASALRTGRTTAGRGRAEPLMTEEMVPPDALRRDEAGLVWVSVQVRRHVPRQLWRPGCNHLQGQAGTPNQTLLHVKMENTEELETRGMKISGSGRF